MHKTILCSTCESASECAENFRTKLKENNYAITLDASLRSIPRSIHFHIRPEGKKLGTLEATFDPNSKSTWISVHANRSQPWIVSAEAEIVSWGCIQTGR